MNIFCCSYHIDYEMKKKFNKISLLLSSPAFSLVHVCNVHFVCGAGVFERNGNWFNFHLHSSFMYYSLLYIIIIIIIYCFITDAVIVKNLYLAIVVVVTFFLKNINNSLFFHFSFVCVGAPSQVGILSILNVNFHHQGNYSCMPSNAASVQVTLHVINGTYNLINF
jgi:uncharacterized membrane protein